MTYLTHCLYYKAPVTATPTSLTSAPVTAIPTSMTSVTTIRIDATLTSNIDCSQNIDENTVNIIEVSIMDDMNAELQPLGVVVLSITVYEICGGSVRRNLQTVESEIKFFIVETSACENCAAQMAELAEVVIEAIVSDGSLSDSIESNSGGTIVVDFSGAAVTSYETISNPPTPAPTRSKSAKEDPSSKSAKNSKTNIPASSKAEKPTVPKNEKPSNKKPKNPKSGKEEEDKGNKKEKDKDSKAKKDDNKKEKDKDSKAKKDEDGKKKKDKGSKKY